MLDKTQVAEVTEKELGIGLQFTCNVGDGRQIGMTAGFPLDWSLDKMNALLDKMSGAMNRQAMKNEIHDRIEKIAALKKQIAANQFQSADHEARSRSDWEGRNKHGNFKMSGNQAIQAQTYITTDRGLRDELDRQQKALEEAKEKCL